MYMIRPTIRLPVQTLFNANRQLHASVPLLDDKPADDKKSYYDILRVPRTATQTEVKDAYYRLSKVYHPDVMKDESSQKVFQDITEAYNTLSSAQARRMYDLDQEKKDTYDTSKVAFYTSLFKDDFDLNNRNLMLEKDFEKRLPRDEWLNFNYFERRKETHRMKKTRLYADEMPTFLDVGTYDRIKVCAVMFYIACFFVYIDEYHEGWDKFLS